MSTPVAPKEPGLLRRIVDSEAFIFVSETWRTVVLLLALGAFTAWLVYDDDVWLRPGFVLLGLVVAGSLLEWWRARPAPLPKPPAPSE